MKEYAVYYKSAEGNKMVGSAYGNNEVEALENFKNTMYVYNGGEYSVTGIKFYKERR